MKQSFIVYDGLKSYFIFTCIEIRPMSTEQVCLQFNELRFIENNHLFFIVFCRNDILLLLELKASDTIVDILGLSAGLIEKLYTV